MIQAVSDYRQGNIHCNSLFLKVFSRLYADNSTGGLSRVAQTRKNPTPMFGETAFPLLHKRTEPAFRPTRFFALGARDGTRTKPFHPSTPEAVMEQALVGTIVPLLSDETNGKDKDYEGGKGKSSGSPFFVASATWRNRRNPSPLKARIYRDNTSFIGGMIPVTHVMVRQTGSRKNR